MNQSKISNFLFFLKKKNTNSVLVYYDNLDMIFNDQPHCSSMPIETNAKFNEFVRCYSKLNHKYIFFSLVTREGRPLTRRVHFSIKTFITLLKLEAGLLIVFAKFMTRDLLLYL